MTIYDKCMIRFSKKYDCFIDHGYLKTQNCIFAKT